MQVYPTLPEVDVEGRELNARLVDDELRREKRDLERRATGIEEYLGRRPKIRIAIGNDPAFVLLETVEEEGPPEKTHLAVGSRSVGALKRLTLVASQARFCG